MDTCAFARLPDTVVVGRTATARRGEEIRAVSFWDGDPVLWRPAVLWAFFANLFYIFSDYRHTKDEVIKMSFVSPAIQTQFESMPIHLKNAILERNVRLESMADLMSCLEQIIQEGEPKA